MGLGLALLAAESPPQGGAMLKTDIMGVFAHPDDETGVASVMAKYALGRDAVVAHVYCTRGEGGGNMVGTQAGPALGILREAELRRCLSRLGVSDYYFLDQIDFFYTESINATLQKWDKEAALKALVRYIRSLRPEVIVTLNPTPRPGQHGHHMAAGVLAVEAFSLAADPLAFPEQLSVEGLSIWQVKKLYWGGASQGAVATISVTEPLIEGLTPGQIAGEALAYHRSQGFGRMRHAPWLSRPRQLTLIKSAVGFSDNETDLLEGLGRSSQGEVTVFKIEGDQRERRLVTMNQRPVVETYRQWSKEQGIDGLIGDLDFDYPVVAGVANDIEFQLSGRLSADTSADGVMDVEAPQGWLLDRTSVVLDANGSGSIKLTPPLGFRGKGELVTVLKEGKTNDILQANRMNLHAVPMLPVSPSGTWFDIGSDLIVQGQNDGPADIHARVKLSYDHERLSMTIIVGDDVVVSNLKPNDIKGHWRTDSVEICIDPEAGAEHTLNCFKLGIIPFDSEGRARAARDADANQGPAEETVPGLVLSSVRTDEGYTVQVSVPWAVLGLEGVIGRMFGFNVILYDGDKHDAAWGENINECRLAWSPRPGVQGRPEDWGRVRLER